MRQYLKPTDIEVENVTGYRGDVAQFARAVKRWGLSGVTEVGGYNRRRIAGTSSWSTHATGRAVDIMIRRSAAEVGQPFADVLTDRRTAIAEVIWRGARTVGSPNGLGRTRPYRGPNPHDDHLHVSFGAELGPDEATWLAFFAQQRPKLRKGARNEWVAMIQRAHTGLVVDGIYGPKTAAAVGPWVEKGWPNVRL